jgi:hypothetical protein
MRFMVVPLTSIGALDVGWTTNWIGDWINATNNKKTKFSAQDQANALMVSATTAAPTPAPTTTQMVVPVGPTLLLSMILNTDYDKLSTASKDLLKTGIQAMLATVAMVDKDKVSVTLTPGSVKVDAEIQTTGANTARTMMATLTEKVTAEDVVEAVCKIPGVAEATEATEEDSDACGLTVTDIEVKMGDTPVAVEAESSSAESSSAADTSTADSTTKQASTSAGEFPGPRLELLLLLLPLVAVGV